MLVSEPKQKWGGPWTEKKLDAFIKYVRSYLTIMKKYPYWETIYFDGFAGSGKRTSSNNDLFQQLSILPEEEEVYEGAAERVIKLPKELKFDYYYFIDSSKDSLQSLKSHLNSFPESNGKRLLFREGNANKYVVELSQALRKKAPSYAALAFLDPFGMQIDWESIASLQGTRSDVWILIPTGVIVNRLLDKKGELKNLKKLEKFFGLDEREIRDHFYKKEIKLTIFGEREEISKVLKPIEKIAELYIQKLKTIWDHVTPKPLRLNNTKGAPIFHFVFASNNRSAVKIAKQIIEKL